MTQEEKILSGTNTKKVTKKSIYDLKLDYDFVKKTMNKSGISFIKNKEQKDELYNRFTFKKGDFAGTMSFNKNEILKYICDESGDELTNGGVIDILVTFSQLVNDMTILKNIKEVIKGLKNELKDIATTKGYLTSKGNVNYAFLSPAEKVKFGLEKARLEQSQVKSKLSILENAGNYEPKVKKAKA